MKARRPNEDSIRTKIPSKTKRPQNFAKRLSKFISRRKTRSKILYLYGFGEGIDRTVSVAEILKRRKKNLKVVYVGITTVVNSPQELGGLRRLMDDNYKITEDTYPAGTRKLVIGLSYRNYEPVYEFLPTEWSKEFTNDIMDEPLYD